MSVEMEEGYEQAATWVCWTSVSYRRGQVAGEKMSLSLAWFLRGGVPMAMGGWSSGRRTVNMSGKKKRWCIL